jgi:hypothetical protein
MELLVYLERLLLYKLEKMFSLYIYTVLNIRKDKDELRDCIDQSQSLPLDEYGLDYSQ